MKYITYVAIFLFGVMVMVACGGGGDTPTSGEEATGPVTIEFEGGDIFFDKDEVTVQSGQEVTIVLNNVGTLEHSWVLVDGSVDPLLATEADALAGATTGDIAGGESASITFVAPPAGDYLFVCTVEGHAAAGMWGDFIVE
ncbi:MAG: plastocyanin/azurin family copper-binding protein [Ardenticatenaceae bacterium]|nr:plastocyanin/azurin family copper-binding protein [Ardenticatenaceae bacterium]